MSVQVQQARKGSMSWIVGVILAIFLLAGCSSTTTVGSDTEPCSPGFQIGERVRQHQRAAGRAR